MSKVGGLRFQWMDTTFPLFRCNGKVFHNERVPTKGKAYHKR